MDINTSSSQQAIRFGRLCCTEMKLLSLVLIAGAAFAARQPFSSEDFWAWRTASDPRISPDGQWIVYVESWSDRAADARFANLWIVSGDGKTRKPLTEGNWRDDSPRWSGDSVRIAWLSHRDGKTQIRTKKVESGPEAEVATGGRTPLNIAVSPEGNAVAFTARVPARAQAPAWAPPTILPRLRQTGSYLQIFVAPVAGGEVKQVSSGEFDNFG
jgi:Tol biopolymer transport system component